MNIWLCDETPRPARATDIEEEAKEKNTKGVWMRMREALDKALIDHPEARTAVIRAIEEEFLSDEAA